MRRELLYKKNIIDKVFISGEKTPILFSSVLLTLGIFLIIICYFSISLIKNSFFIKPIDKKFYVISKQNTLLNTFSQSFSNINEKDIEEIKKIKGVLDVGKVHSSRFRSRVMVFGNINFKSEIFLESIDNKFLDLNNENFFWKLDSNSVPLVISREFLNLYNYSFAKATGLPMLTEKTASLIPLSFEIDSRDGTSYFPSRIIGFSDRFLSLFVPISFLNWANKNFSNEENDIKSSKIIIEINQNNPGPFFKFIENNNYMLHNDNSVLSEKLKLVEKFILFFLVLGIIIIFISLFFIYLSNQIIFEKELSNISELMLIGYSIRTIKNRLFAHSFIGVFVSFILSISLSIIFILNVKNYVSDFIDYEFMTVENLSFFAILFLIVSLTIFYFNRKLKIRDIL